MSVVEFGHSEHSFDHSRSKSRQLAGNAALNVVVELESNPHASTAVTCIPRTRSKVSHKTGFKSSSTAIGSRTGGKDVANAPGTPKTASVGNAFLSYSPVRKLSSTSCLRRMHLSRSDAAAFFPEGKETIEFIFATDTRRCVTPELFKFELAVSLQDGQGRRWPVVLECLRSAGQRHVRLNKEWAEVCRATGLSVGTSIPLVRLEQASSSRDALVTELLVYSSRRLVLGKSLTVKLSRLIYQASHISGASRTVSTFATSTFPYLQYFVSREDLVVKLQSVGVSKAMLKYSDEQRPKLVEKWRKVMLKIAPPGEEGARVVQSDFFEALKGLCDEPVLVPHPCQR